MRIYRLTKDHYKATAFAGIGAVLNPGRWHRKGTPLVYASDQPASALLEVLVHTEAHELLNDAYVLFEIDLEPERHLSRLPTSEYPDGWRAQSWSRAPQAVGTAWAERQVSVVLEVRSAVVPHQRNYLVNPYHPLFSELSISEPQTFKIDPRLGDR